MEKKYNVMFAQSSLKQKKLGWILLLYFGLTILSCSDIKINNNLEKFESLIEGDMSMLSTMSPELLNKLEANKLVPHFDTIRYQEKKIYVSVVKVVNGCSKNIGNIQINGDTIILMHHNTSNYACTSQILERMRYSIKNDSNKEFTILKN